MRSPIKLLGLILLCCSSALPTFIHADEFQPLAIRISLTAGNAEQGYVYSVATSIPNDQRLSEIPSAKIGDTCTLLSKSLTQQANKSYRKQESYRCQNSLHGATIKIVYQAANPGLSSLIAVDLGNGHTASTALAAHQAEWIIPDKLDSFDVTEQYFELGVVHLLTGFDHLLFIACLLFICLGEIRKLVWTITAFTVAHSLSLGFTAFGKITINVAAVEAIIALSIAYLASDIARHVLYRKDGASASLSYRYPASIAGVFGLLHGLGFANILNEFGLPQSDKLLALFSFNIGIEIGQLMFVFSLIALASIFKRMFASLNTPSFSRGVSLTASYLIGCVALFWTIERIANSL